MTVKDFFLGFPQSLFISFANNKMSFFQTYFDVQDMEGKMLFRKSFKIYFKLSLKINLRKLRWKTI